MYNKITFSLLLCRSLVEDDDAHMKVALGYGDMGISAHLQASKTGNTRFFTSNTHSSVVLQVGLTFSFLRYVFFFFKCHIGRDVTEMSKHGSILKQGHARQQRQETGADKHTNSSANPESHHPPHLTGCDQQQFD